MLSSPVQCWECERPARFPRLVTVRLPDFTIGPLTLCPTCYTAVYLPLTVDTERHRSEKPSSRPLH